MVQILPPNKFELATLGTENRTSVEQRFLLEKASNNLTVVHNRFSPIAAYGAALLTASMLYRYA
jgi:hypothetical protein